MKKLLLGLFIPLALASLVRGATAGLTSVPFSTSQAQFTGGDSITIDEVLSTSTAMGLGDTVVVRGTYTLQTRAAAFIQIQLTASGTGPSYSPPRKNITAGSGTYELEYSNIQQVGSLHVTFYPDGGGSSFGGIYFAPPQTTGTPTSPAVVPPITTSGLAIVPFSMSQAQFANGDSITIQEVLASSPNLALGDSFVVRGTYTLQSQEAAIMSISLTTTEPVGVPYQATARKQITAGTGTFEMAYTVQFAGSIYIAFTPVTGGSSFGRIYLTPPQTSVAPTNPTSPIGAAISNPVTNTGRLANLAVRSVVSPGAGALIAGLTVTEQERYVLIRGVGPTLSALGVTGVLAKPMLSVYKANGELMATTGSWSTAFTAEQRAGIAMVTSAVGGFALAAGSEDAVLHLRLVPGSYTISVSSADGQSGAALLEVYASPTFTLPASP